MQEEAGCPEWDVEKPWMVLQKSNVVQRYWEHKHL